MKCISVVGAGYVGFSLSVLLSQKNNVTVHDTNKEKVNLINLKKSPIKDVEIIKYLNNKKLNLTATNSNQALKNAELVIVATPTDYDEITNQFDTSSVDMVLEEVIKVNPDATIIIKSTVPVGYTKHINQKLNTENIIFSPEFLREGKALYDNLFPSRIIIGSKCSKAKEFAELLIDVSLKDKKDINTLFTSATEAEAIKLFSNTYLAMRVAFFNELDSFSLVHNLEAEEIINGVCLDPRIGAYYNNPSFGYGGYCLPKDTKQLLSNYKNIPNKLIQAIVEANSTRKDFISNLITLQKPRSVGIFGLAMKQGSDNFRASAILGIIKRLKAKGIKIYIFEPSLSDETYLDLVIIKDLREFKKVSDIILTNRTSKDLQDVKDKVFTRDLFGID